MKLLRTLLIGSDENIEQRNMIWNMLGSFLYAFASMVLTIAVIQVVGMKIDPNTDMSRLAILASTAYLEAENT